MTCQCNRCDGAKVIECPACLGDGDAFVCISDAELDSSLHHYIELVNLKNDARRVKTEAARLIELVPGRQDSYRSQLRAVLNELNDQADELVKR